MKDAALRRIAYQRRLEILDMVYRTGSGHIGGDMSCIDALVTLYYDVMDVQKMLHGEPDADKFVLSKGHCAEALYTVLADCGFFPKEQLKTYAQFGTRLAEHPTHGLPGVDIATGALGHGFPVACGMALGRKRSGVPGHVYTLMGDGEQAEGSIWEAVMFAAKYGLDNLTAIVDRNHLQISGSTEEVMPLGDLADHYRTFGWSAVECNGHDFAAMCKAFSSRVEGKPTVVVLDTVKGKGSVLMENQAVWHHQIPNQEQYQQIKADLLRAAEEE
jgi:transketolase